MAFGGLLAGLALVAYVIESYLPPPLPLLPMARIGVANVFVLWALYAMGLREAAAAMGCKALLGPLLAGTPFGVVYALAGAALSLPAMMIATKTKLRPVTAGAIGGALHPVGQVLCAALLMRTPGVMAMLPWLFVMGAVSGAAGGILVGGLQSRMKSRGRGV